MTIISPLIHGSDLHSLIFSDDKVGYFILVGGGGDSIILLARHVNGSAFCWDYNM
jgi:hypothetical protein